MKLNAILNVATLAYSLSSSADSLAAFRNACFGTKRARTHADCVHCRAYAAA